MARIGIAVLAGLCALVSFASPAAATTIDSDPPMGLMIQVSTLAGTTSPATLKSWLEDIRLHHRDKAKAGYINTVVLQDIADRTGALYATYLDVISPYLPGGRTPAFTRAYAGTVDLPWTGAGSKYIEGIESSDFRNTNLKMSRLAASAFTARYPKNSIDWYVTYEANLSGAWDSAIETAYRIYLSQLMSALSGIRGNRAFLWSPAFWTSRAAMPAWAASSLRVNLTDLFTHLPTRLDLDVQDFVGQSGGKSTPLDAADWISYLAANWASGVAQVEINAEQFTVISDGGTTAADPVEVANRLKYYASKSFSLGPAWEIRFWHRRLYGA